MLGPGPPIRGDTTCCNCPLTPTRSLAQSILEPWEDYSREAYCRGGSLADPVPGEQMSRALVSQTAPLLQAFAVIALRVKLLFARQHVRT